MTSKVADLKNHEKREQVRSDNDASEWVFWDILGHIGTLWDVLGQFGTFRDILGQFGSHFRPFSPIFGSLKQTRYGRTDERTDRYVIMESLYTDFFKQGNKENKFGTEGNSPL